MNIVNIDLNGARNTMNLVLNFYWSILYYQHIQAQLISNVNSVPNLSSLF